MGQQSKRQITMNFSRSFTREDNGRAEIKAIAKDVGLTFEQVEKDLESYLEYQEKFGKRKINLN